MIKFIRITIAVILIIPFFVLVSIIALPLNLIFRLCKWNKLSDGWIRFWVYIIVWWVMFFLGAKVIITGQKNIPAKGNKICFIANHQSMIDIVALFLAKGTSAGVIGKIEVKKIPLVNFWFDSLRCVYLDRKSPRDSIKAILQGSKNIENGRAMGVFPEGTRSKDNQIHEFKAGSFKMATRVGALIVPVTIRNTRLLLEGVKNFKRIRVYIDYGMPIDSSKLTEEELHALPNLVETMIKTKAEELDQLNVKKRK